MAALIVVRVAAHHAAGAAIKEAGAAAGHEHRRVGLAPKGALPRSRGAFAVWKATNAMARPPHQPDGAFDALRPFESGIGWEAVTLNEERRK